MSSEKYSIKKEEIKTEKFTYKFTLPIEKVIFYRGKYIVLLNVPSDSIEIDNIYCLSESGNIVWRVQDAGKAFGITNNTPYVDIIEKDDHIYINNFFGLRFRLNPQNGVLEEKICVGW